MYSVRLAEKKNTQIKRLRIALAAVFLVFCFILSAFGGKGIVPTWDQLYNFFGIAAASPLVPPEAGETQIHFIDVGQGDSVLIQQSGYFALIDAGPQDGEQQLVAYLEQKGVDTLQLVVMTHPDADHIGGMDAVIGAIPVKELWIPNFSKAEKPKSAEYEDVLKQAEAAGVEITVPRDGARVPIGDGVLTLISDGVSQRGKDPGFNDLSLCTRFDVGTFSFLNTGDAEEMGEEKLLQEGCPVKADLFKAGHHGSDTSNSLEMLQAIQPKITVVSCENGNPYGHPHTTALDHFEKIGTEVYRTDLLGNIIVAANRYGETTVYTEYRNPRYPF